MFQFLINPFQIASHFFGVFRMRLQQGEIPTKCLQRGQRIFDGADLLLQNTLHQLLLLRRAESLQPGSKLQMIVAQLRQIFDNPIQIALKRLRAEFLLSFFQQSEAFIRGLLERFIAGFQEFL